MANKKILISALAGLLAAPVVQAAVDDAGMRYTSAAEGFYGSIRVIYNSSDNDDKKTDSTAVTANDRDGTFSRIGIRGSSDLGGGLEATYRWEFGINGNNQNPDAISRTRIASVGLTGGFGAVTFGTQWANDYNHAFGRTDITNGTSGNFAPAFRKDGVINYDSPSLNGLNLSAGVEIRNTDQSEEASAVTAISAIAPGTAASSNPIADLDFAASGDSKEDNNIDAYSLGASYTIRGIDLFAAYRVDVDAGTDRDVSIGLNQNAASPAGAVENGVRITNELDRDDVSHFGAGIAYGQDNWNLTYLYITGDNADNTSDDYTAHSFAGQVAVEKLTFRAVYETKETENSYATHVNVNNAATAGLVASEVSTSNSTGDVDANIFTVEAQYNLGSRSRVWIAYLSNDDDVAGDAQTFHIGHRVDF